MLKLEPSSDGKRTVVRLIKRAGAEHLGEIMNQLGRSGPKAALDLEEVTVVDVHVVRLLGRCEKEGTELFHCPPYVREWITPEPESMTLKIEQISGKRRRNCHASLLRACPQFHYLSDGPCFALLKRNGRIEQREK